MPADEEENSDETAGSGSDWTEAAAPDESVPEVIREVAMPDYSKMLREAVMPNLAEVMREVAMPDYSKMLREAVMPNLTETIRDTIALPRFSELLREVVAGPAMATSILSLLQTQPAKNPTAGFGAASRELFSSLGVEEDPWPFDFDVRPTTDDAAFRAIAAASPDMAAAISRAAKLAGNPLLPWRVIRNMLAWLVMSLVVVAYVGGTVLFPPWGPLAVALLSASGVTAPAAYRKISPPPRDDTSPERSA